MAKQTEPEVLAAPESLDVLPVPAAAPHPMCVADVEKIVYEEEPTDAA